MVTLPATLLAAIAAEEGGRVVLVVGAGCSFEPPTELPLTKACAIEAHRRLLADGLLEKGECDNPSDLSLLADLIKSKNGGRQIELVNRLPTTEFKTATANEGHKIAAALLVERAISNVVTLNFDLALSHALSDIGTKAHVCVVAGPEQHHHLGAANVIYLHRCVDADPEDLVLTTDALELAWKDGWEEVIAQHVMATPITVFAGLGSSCGVLRHSASKLRAALGERAQLLLVNPGDPEDSIFASEIEISEENYIQLGWIEFMRMLSSRFHSEVVGKIGLACQMMSRREGWIDEETEAPLDDTTELLSSVERMGLLSFGKTRAGWLLELESREYPKLETGHISSIADLLIAVRHIEQCANVTAILRDDGHVIFTKGDSVEVQVLLVDGGAENLRWLSLETTIQAHNKNGKFRYNQVVTNKVLACGVTGTKVGNATPPESIVGEQDSTSIIDGELKIAFWDVDEIRNDSAAIAELLT